MTTSEFTDFDIFRVPISSGLESSLISSRPTVMVIDDDENIRETLQLALKGLFDVIACASGAEGIAALTPNVSAVILDIKMKGKDGFETYAEIRERYANLPDHLPLSISGCQGSHRHTQHLPTIWLRIQR
jgi:CheY-like chemotaxis protein